ncbi:FAD dependent oxidoreductase [Deinococcus phoenicis]|uniref:FAD dependent oxidoreductase n=1 Tax=Deinococcus phoenicis TaxID=1476583 RepID=A0A016QRZ8_9DEIO|nr:FAD-dependent oxidoreductase [Deinococcus phoenicis]EYB68524.1 FAD dependent oxidoreductase [Deinococcus phoenicis]
MRAAPHLLVIGGGVAGASVAWFAGQAGARVTVVDAGQHAASHVPSALVNPVRGQSGQVARGALEGMRLTWALVDTLEKAGIGVPHGQTGVLRPVPDDRTRQKFGRNLPPDLPHTWLGPDQSPAPLTPGWPHALWLPEGGWLDGAAFTAALLALAGADVVRARAQTWDARSVTLENGEVLCGDAVVWCGGSVGAAWAGEPGTHRAGTLLTLDRAVAGVPVSFGAYLAPARTGGVLGATFEAPTATWREPALPAASLRWLLGRADALTDLSGAQVTGRWSGTRLSGLVTGRGADGVWRLGGLGSKGFLLGPLLARHVAGDVLAGLRV